MASAPSQRDRASNLGPKLRTYVPWRIHAPPLNWFYRSKSEHTIPLLVRCRRYERMLPRITSTTNIASLSSAGGSIPCASS
eukprot:2956098-Pyramimonas_sp.AAC.1